jgi:hypothetical protein
MLVIVSSSYEIEVGVGILDDGFVDLMVLEIVVILVGCTWLR